MREPKTRRFNYSLINQIKVMNLFDPQIMHMVLILPGLLGLSLFYDAVNKRKQEERLWWLSIISGILIIVTAIGLFVLFQRVYRF